MFKRSSEKQKDVTFSDLASLFIQNSVAVSMYLVPDLDARS